MKRDCLLLPLFIFCTGAQLHAQVSGWTSDSIRIVIDKPADIRKNTETIICFYALPNGNTTEQTMGKTMREGDDWRFDIQHIKAQALFIRQQLVDKCFIVIYLENNLKSWPAWKQKHPGYKQRFPALVDSLTALFKVKKKSVYLNGHSGGGSFILGYIASVHTIPANVKRISFLDSNYGYDSSYYPALYQWLQRKNTYLNVFAYNDSVALYNGKPVVSAKGGTWYRSHLMLSHLAGDYSFTEKKEDSITSYQSRNNRIRFFFKSNPERKIFHTQQVELNGFIHSILCGTIYDSKGYHYYGKRAYTNFITDQKLNSIPDEKL